ncbi:MAG: Fur family transcriptional regulator [Acidovorax sp.]
MTVKQEILAELDRVNMRATVPRVKLLEIMRHDAEVAEKRKGSGAGARHFTVDYLFKRMLELKVDVGLATVYRVAQQFTEVGILKEARFDNDRVVYELNDGRQHDHIVCLSCGAVDEFFDPTLAARQKAMADQLGYMLAGHQMALYGYCSKCRPKLAVTTQKGRSAGRDKSKS